MYTLMYTGLISWRTWVPVVNWSSNGTWNKAGAEPGGPALTAAPTAAKPLPGGQQGGQSVVGV